MSLAVLVASAIRAHGADGCCAHCGCACSCQKVCRLVCEEKKVDVICWGCKCEDFCVPGHSKPGCQHCEEVCDDCDEPCDCTAPYAKPKKFVWTDWIPGSAQDSHEEEADEENRHQESAQLQMGRRRPCAIIAQDTQTSSVPPSILGGSAPN